MEDISALHSAIERPLGTNATHKQPGPGKIVMISSHPGWPARREFHGDDGGESEIAADTVHLTRVFHEVLERVRQGPVLNMDDESVTIRTNDRQDLAAVHAVGWPYSPEPDTAPCTIGTCGDLHLPCVAGVGTAGCDRAAAGPQSFGHPG